MVTIPTLTGHEIAPFDQETWDRWKARGLVSDAAMTAKMRSIALIAGATFCFAASLWMLT